MSIALPERPSRRVASRRKVIAEEDEDSSVDNTRQLHGKLEVEDNYEPVAAKSGLTSPKRRATASESTTPRRRDGATRRTRPSESIEPTQIFSPPESVIDEPNSPTKKSPPKRRTVKDARAARKSRVSRISIINDAPDESGGLPTPETSISPEPQIAPGTPLRDITESTINEQTPKVSLQQLEPAETCADTTKSVDTPIPAPRIVTKVDPNVTKLEKPMDIMIKTRAVGMPQSHEPAMPTARMTITYLILTNFKSYAGRQEVGPFHASFSSVVGPNGSGKSNVIDSLLFVFGFRASKMRQGKLSALIHNSAGFPDLEFCEVEVHFQEVIDQPNGGTAVVPDSQLIISRRAFKNNSSSYYINGRTSKFTAVTTLLKGKGVDLDHKRFLILQGEVESIAQMKPKATGEHDDGLLEYLEDIIGTSKYKTPIEEAAVETEALNEVCLEKNTRVSHVEKEKNGLEDKKNKALAYIKDENDLALKKSSLYQVYISECGDNIQVAQEACAETQQQLDQELQKHQGSEDDIKRLEKQYKTESQELEKFGKNAQGLLKELARLDKETVKFEEKKKFLSNKAKKLEKTLESSDLGISEARTAAKNGLDDISRIQGEVAKLEDSLRDEDQELNKIRDKLKGKTQGISDEIANKQKTLEPWNAKISEKQSAMAVAQSELDILREKESVVTNSMAQVEAKIAALEEQREAKSAELKECKRQQQKVDKEAKEAQKKLDYLIAQEPAFKTKLSNSRQKADEARASLSATQSHGNVLAGLTRLKESGRIEGFHGRLGDLGAIDQKFDVAISTACPQLDNLIVDSVEVGQQCLEYLRKNNLGRATIICLNQLAKRDLSPKPTPENALRLFDLVKSKHERFLPAFYNVLQDTLVATDLEQANRVAYGAKRWRVVTLNGQLIDKSGTMTGGGTKVMKGGMSSNVSADVTREQVAKLEVDRDALEKEYSALMDTQREIQSQVQQLQNQVPKLETQSQKLSLELESIDRNITDSRRRLQELATESQPSKADNAKIATLEKAIPKMQSDIENLQSETASIEDQIKELQDQIMEIGGIQLRSQKAKVDGLHDQISSLNENLGLAEVAKTKAEKQLIKHQKTTEDAAKDLDKTQSELAKVDEDAKAQNKANSALRKQAEEAQQALEEKKEQLQELKSQLDAQTAEFNESRGIEVEMRNKLEENKVVLADNQKRLKYWQEKLGRLELKNISDDGQEGEAQPLPELSRDELEDLSKEDLKAAIAALEERTSHHVDLAVLAEYRRRVAEHSSRLADLTSALASRDAAKKRLDDLRRLRLEGFMEGFSTISLRLKEMYQMITMGGNAELELVDSLDPFAEGILFSVMPPKKSWKNISNLSGGEKTLSSLALVFALHHYKPTPLYVMDEIDAALDFRNVSIVAAYIKERTKNAQFIVISLRNNMFELASRLVGVYKVNHMTKSVTIENKDYITARA